MKISFTELLNALRRQKFLRKHPGPFACFAGSEGVDDTIDVVCLHSDARIATFRYWEWKQRATDCATLVAAALNRLAEFPAVIEEQYSNQIEAFDLSELAEHDEREFTPTLDHCPNYGPQWLVHDQENRTIIECTDWDLGTRPKQTAYVIANALNRLQLAVQREA